MHLEWASILGAIAGLSSAAAIEKRAGCSSYTLIDTRGTGEPQGPSAGFITMNKNVLAQVPGGKVYNTVYDAGALQNSGPGTQDIVNKIKTTLAKTPNECFILEGYSQGATATVEALRQLSGANFNAVKGVFLIGDPEHKPGLACNVDNNGGKTTLNAVGIEAAITLGIPANWISKTLDVCISRDNVCDFLNPLSAGSQVHLQYPSDAPTQNLGTSFVVGRLRSG